MSAGSAEAWIPVILFVVGTLFAAVGSLIFWVLKGIKENQKNIWDWAKEEVSELRNDVKNDKQTQEKRLTDLNQFIRHSERTMYGEIISLAKVCGKGGEHIIDSIEHTLRNRD